MAESQNHRMVWVGMDLKDHLVPSPCHEQGHLPLDRVAQSSIQPGVGHCQGGAATASLGNRGHCFTTLKDKAETQRSQGEETDAARDLTHAARRSVTLGSNSEITILDVINVLLSR